MEKVIINTDIGGDFDDTLALALALNSPEIQVVGVITTKQHIRDKALFARKLLDAAGRPDVPVFYAGQVLGDDGYMNVLEYGFLSDDDQAKSDEENRISSQTIEFLVRMLNEKPGEITLVSLAPNTNIAQALEQDPSIGEKIKAVYAMGGVLDREGGKREHPEHNYRVDRQAFNALCRQTSFPVYFLPRNLTYDVFLPADVLREQRERSPFASCLWHLAKKFSERTGYDSFRLSDPITVGAVVKPDLYVSAPHHFHRSETKKGEIALARPTEQGNVHCFTDFDREKFYDLLVRRL